MEKALKLPINLSKIDKTEIFDYEGDKFINIILWPVEESQWGSVYQGVQQMSQEKREAGNKGPSLGYAKYLKRDNAVKSEPKDSVERDDDMPF